ncbi:MAG: hypothetical protein NTX88_03075, partial [Candidatus Atribacteria bacterium]|nr:hypothetical protein [Candidatus Atribacteria bacterium]
MVERIIEEQEKIIGPIALEEASKVSGLKVDLQKHQIQFEGNEKDVVEKLVEKYRDFFGQASVEVCKKAAGEILDKISKED